MTRFSRVNPLWEYETTAIANYATVYATASRARPNKQAPPKGHDHWYHMPEQARRLASSDAGRVGREPRRGGGLCHRQRL